MAALGAMVGVGVMAVIASLRGVTLFPRFSSLATEGIEASQRLLLWLIGAFVATVIVLALSGWPVAALWTFAGVMSIPLLRGSGPSADEAIAKVEAIATWSEQIRDTMNAAAGLQQALVATAVRGPQAIEDELREFARRAPRGDLAGALRQLGRDLDHPSADMVIAGLISAIELDAGRLVQLLSRLALSIREEAHMRVRVEVGRARIRTSMKIVGFCVTGTAMLLLVFGGDLLGSYDSTGGQIWLLVVGAVVVVAMWSSRKLARVPQPDRFVARQVAA